MKKKRLLIWIVVAVAVLLLAVALFLRNRNIPLQEETRIYIPENATFQQVMDTLTAHHCIGDVAVFEAMASAMSYPQHVKDGSYLIRPGISPLKLVRKLNAGDQDPIRLTINKHRTPKQLCDYLGTKLMLSSDSLLALMQDSSICGQYGYTPQTIICMFVQNTYEVYWNVSPKGLLDRMSKESARFWNDYRRDQCLLLDMSPDEVITLASIVEEETNKNDEKPKIASVYLNRLRIGMPLQADPTVKYAVGNFALRRILNRHLEVNSPYNTYRNKGLPPGPICIPSVASIDAVLQNFESPYLYFCAKEDFSGYHNFASSLAQHQNNAARFHQALNNRGIR